jgi:hypothetical protein
MPRTDMTQEIDGAFADRNAGQRHFSEIARSGNGDMRTDLNEDQADFQEVAGLGETTEPMTTQESATIDAQGAAAPPICPFRLPQPGEVPPFAAKPGYTWLRRRTPTGTRQPGGNRLVKNTWVQVSAQRLAELKGQGLNGLGITATEGIGISIALGLAVGAGIWWFLKHKKATA